MSRRSAAAESKTENFLAPHLNEDRAVSDMQPHIPRCVTFTLDQFVQFPCEGIGKIENKIKLRNQCVYIFAYFSYDE
jgi:hypothetical protein